MTGSLPDGKVLLKSTSAIAWDPYSTGRDEDTVSHVHAGQFHQLCVVGVGERDWQPA